MKSKFLKITGIVIAVAVLAFSFFYTKSPESENVTSPVLTTSDVEEVKNQEKETEIFTEEPKEDKTLKENVSDTLTTDTVDKVITVSEEIPVSFCTISVDCKSIYDNIADFPEEKHSLLPPDGYILPPFQIEFDEGESAFDVLKRELMKRKIHFEFSTASYDSAYIEGINNIYEFDCGELSGWIYSVNGIVPQYSCSEYKLKNQDVVKFTYSCTLEQSTQIN